MRLRTDVLGFLIIAACGDNASTPDAHIHIDASDIDAPHHDAHTADAFDGSLAFNDATTGSPVTALDFGSATVGQTVSLAVVAANVGSTPTGALTVTVEEPTGPAGSDYALDGSNTTCDAAVGIGSGSSCNFAFTFTPTATGARVGDFHVALVVPAFDVDLTLRGSGE